MHILICVIHQYMCMSVCVIKERIHTTNHLNILTLQLNMELNLILLQYTVVRSFELHVCMANNI